MIKFTCPICDKNFYNSSFWPHVPSTSWSDDCCCCDQNFCIAHQFNPSDAPERPSDEMLLKRAELRCQKEEKNFNEKIKKITKKYEQLKKLSDLALQIKEYFGWSFETFEEFEQIMKAYKDV